MIIRGNTIIFKSEGSMYYKERDNEKCNTVRRFSKWEELKAFLEFKELFENKYSPEQTIRINGGTEGFFEREITDICSYEGYFIISWKPE